MLYAMLIYQAEGALDHLTEAEQEELLAGHRELQNDTKASAAFVAATQLMETHTATTVRTRGRQVTVQEGPFAESKELLIGFYLFDCADLEAAVEHARRIPHAALGSVEIRPVAYFEDHAGRIET